MNPVRGGFQGKMIFEVNAKLVGNQVGVGGSVVEGGFG